MSRPLPFHQALLSAFLIVLAMGIYCLAYNITQGRAETAWNAFSWPVINLLPFFAAFELSKRVVGGAERSIVLIGAGILSLGLEWLAAGDFQIAFEAVRRIPAIFVVIIAIFVSDFLAARVPRPAADSTLPLLPRQIEWVAAAGNYVVLHGSGCRVMHRATLTEIEKRLKPHGFIRVHRSRLVRHDAVAQVRTVDVILNDGTSITTGSRFRSSLDR